MDIIAHRGASGEAPENTLAAFELAWRQQADGIEMDVHLSRDGRVMVHHDPDTRRCGGVELRIADTGSVRLRELDVGCWKAAEFAGQRMPYLEEALGTVPAGRRVLIEIKCGPEIVPVLAEALHAVSHARITLISFRLDSLDACRARLPEIPCCYLIEAADTGYDPDLIELARTRGYTGLDPEYRGIDADFAARVHAAGLELLTWTVNDPSWMTPLSDWGVAGVTTDWPVRMRRALDESCLPVS
jgi:glycerophosphoryl diester phosphodiesterase